MNGRPSRMVEANGSRRSWLRASLRGLRRRCPACGAGSMFAGYLKIRDRCASCDLDLSGHRADDAPPYVTIMIVGHVAIPLALAARECVDWPLGFQFLVWTPIILVMTAAMLPAVKGGIVGLQWANAMHGFGDGEDRPAIP